jgi:hypothetical protein
LKKKGTPVEAWKQLYTNQHKKYGDLLDKKGRSGVEALCNVAQNLNVRFV